MVMEAEPLTRAAVPRVVDPSLKVTVPPVGVSVLGAPAATLDRWLTDPGASVKGTTMVFIGLPRKPVRQNIIAYLKTLK